MTLVADLAAGLGCCDKPYSSILQSLCIFTVTDVSKLTVEGDDGLLEGRQELQALGDETKRALKKNVYENYLKFIDAAKEISSKCVSK